jgi:hypothetical protein
MLERMGDVAEHDGWSVFAISTRSARSSSGDSWTTVTSTNPATNDAYRRPRIGVARWASVCLLRP